MNCFNNMSRKRIPFSPRTKYSYSERANYHQIFAFLLCPAGSFPSEAAQRIRISSSNFSSFAIACFSISSAKVSTGRLSTSMSKGMWTVMVPEVLADGAWSLAAVARIDTPGRAGAGILSAHEQADDVGSDGAKSWVDRGAVPAASISPLR